GTDNQAWHHYGVMLIETNAEQVKPTTPMLYNGSFEADKWTFLNNTDSGHGYLDNANAGIISGWQFTNLTNTAMRAGMAWVGGPCKDFIGTQTPTDGNQLAWIQSGSNVDARLYQNIYGFDPTDKDTVYRVTMDLGGRTATGNPSVSLFIGANQATEDTYINSKEVTKGKFKEYSAVFVPNAEMQTIAIRNQTSGDTSLLVDNVQLKAYTLTTFFSDNYQVSGNRKGSNIGKNDSDPEDRFGGLLGAMAYKVSVASNDQIQVGNGDTFPQGGTGTCEGSLFFATHNNGYEQSHASPDYNFANVGAMSAADEGGRMYDISFRVAPQYDEDAGSSNWAAILFGLSEGKQTTANVNGGDGVGILFRRNGGIQVFDRTSCIVDLGGGTFTLKDDWADVRLVFYVPAFDGTSPVEVSLYVNEILISSFQTAKGFSNNFIQLEAYSGNSGYKRSLMDDLVIKSTAELQYDVSRIQDMTRAWSPNGKDKLTTIVFNAPNVKEDSNVNHTGALKMEANTTIDIGEGLTLLQSGGISGNYDLTKTGEGTLQIYNEAENGVDIQHLIASSGRLDVKGVMKGSIQVKRGATFSPGNSVGTVDISGEFIADAYAKLLFEQDASGMDVLTASSYDIDGDAEIILDITAIIPGATYDIIVNSSDAGFNAEQGVESYWLGLMSDFPYYMNLSVVDNHMVRLYIDPNAVPEPSTWALLVLGVVVLFLRKRS
ncbi:MAG: PEP-CTERM sorting domain-containing protein, partial [Thermoguttaceae bacterium]|nr:PEP-CTERM sorting domain-containing protein [Thermoguttaceae bacterium]